MKRQVDISAVCDQILRGGGILIARSSSAGSPLWTPVSAADCVDEATLMLNLTDSAGDVRIAFQFPLLTLLNASEPTNIVFRMKGVSAGGPHTDYSKTCEVVPDEEAKYT